MRYAMAIPSLIDNNRISCQKCGDTKLKVILSIYEAVVKLLGYSRWLNQRDAAALPRTRPLHQLPHRRANSAAASVAQGYLRTQYRHARGSRARARRLEG